MRIPVMAVLGFALTTLTSPASAYVVESVTSIAVADAEDATRLDNALQSALDDMRTKGIAFQPTEVRLLDARVVGDRIYLLMLFADQDGEAALKALSTEVDGRNAGTGESFHANPIR